MFCCWGVYTETKTKVLLLVIHQQWTSVSVNPASKKRIWTPLFISGSQTGFVKFTRIIQLRRDFSEHEINRSGSKTFSNNITLLCAEEAASQSMNVVLQKKSRAVDCPVGSNRNTTRSFVLVINLQFFTCGHAKFRFLHFTAPRFILNIQLLWPQSIRARRQNEGGSPASSRWAGTLTVGAHRPWNICLFRESFLFTFNRAVNCLSERWSADHRRSDTSSVGPNAPTLTFQRPSTPLHETGYRK